MSRNHINIPYPSNDDRVKHSVKIQTHSLGSALAMIISWSLHKSIGWAILHGIFGWFYVLFYWLTLQ